MASGWQSKLARVSRMEWDEIRVRSGQEFHKQRDLLLHRIGVRREAMRLNGDSAARAGQFFFSAVESPEGATRESSARAGWLRKHLPDAASEILREADEICSHRFRLLGYDNLDFTPARSLDRGNGNFRDIDWHLDAVHGKRAPLDPWFKIPFLDFAAVGDHKVIWELNRHQHLVTLAKARLLTGNEKYVRELRAQWHSWINANPYPLGINWGSTLEVAFRSLSWIWVDQLLGETREYASLHAELLPALAFHGLYIERYLSAYFSPNTHLLGEALALLFLGTLYPQFPRAAHWRESAWKIVVREAERQVLRDGIYFEQTLHYHVYALDFFLYARLLRARNGMEIPAAYDAVVGRMLDVVEALAQAGPAEGFGDDDGGRLWNPRRNRTEHMTDPLALGAVMYSREFSAAQLTEEAIWLFGNEAAEALSQKPDKQTRTSARSVGFPDGGLYLLADSEPYAQVLAVDAGPQGMGRAGHGHADALSLRLAMDGRRWLVDAGSGVYISDDPAGRNAFRGTGAHNTLRVDGLDQAVPAGPFSWTHIPAARAENWIAGKSFTYFVGSHNGYARLQDPVIHRRHILKVDGGVCLVRDVALGRAEHELEILWHFAPDLVVRNVAGARLVEVFRAGSLPGESRLSLVVPEKTIWPTALEVTKTMVSPAYGSLQPAPLVRCHGRALLPAEMATALVSGRVNGQAEHPIDKGFVDSLIQPRLSSTAHAAVQVYELDYHYAIQKDDARERHAFFFALDDSNSNEAWSFGPWSSDADVLYCRIENEKLAQLVVIGGTHVAWQGRSLVQLAARSEFFEWRRQGGQNGMVNSVPAELSITGLFEELPSLSLASHNLPGPSSSGQASPDHGLSDHGLSDQRSTNQDSSNQGSSQSLSSPTSSPYAGKH
jgi:Heparinase II/III-like protein/Heparinase II/III N-terminus